MVDRCTGRGCRRNRPRPVRRALAPCRWSLVWAWRGPVPLDRVSPCKEDGRPILSADGFATAAFALSPEAQFHGHVGACRRARRWRERQRGCGGGGAAVV